MLVSCIILLLLWCGAGVRVELHPTITRVCSALEEERILKAHVYPPPVNMHSAHIPSRFEFSTKCARRTFKFSRICARRTSGRALVQPGSWLMAPCPRAPAPSHLQTETAPAPQGPALLLLHRRLESIPETCLRRTPTPPRRWGR